MSDPRKTRVIPEDTLIRIREMLARARRGKAYRGLAPLTDEDLLLLYKESERVGAWPHELLRAARAAVA